MSDPFQSGPPGNGDDEELPTVRVRPGSTPADQPGAFPPAPQPNFGAANQYPPAGPGSQPQPPFGAPPAQPAFGAPPPPPAFGSQPQPGFGAPPPPPPAFGSQPQPPYGAPPQGYPPPQPGFGAPPPPAYPPTQPGFSGPPPGFSGTQPPYGAPPQGYPQQPGFPPPGGAMYSPPRKRRGGLFALIAIIVVVALIVGVVGVLALTHKSGSTSTSNTNSSSTPTTAATPTPSVPSGFQKFSNSQYSIAYPGSWSAKASSSGTGEQFTGPDAQVFQVDLTPNASSGEEAAFNTGFCGVLNSKGGATTPTAITIGGQTWQQLDCKDDGTLHAVVESVVYKGTLYSLSYLSTSLTFDSDKTQYYGPMEQSFAFGS